MTALPASFPIVTITAFACFWLGGAALMSRVAGWHALSALYPAPARPSGDSLAFCTVTLGNASFPITYRRCVRVALSERGLGLGLMRPFRFHSPPFSVPWAAVTGFTEKQLIATVKVTLSFAGSDRKATFAGALGQAVKARYLASAAAQPRPLSQPTEATPEPSS